MEKGTTIWVSMNVKEQLDKLKADPRQAYSKVIEQLLCDHKGKAATTKNKSK